MRRLAALALMVLATGAAAAEVTVSRDMLRSLGTGAFRVSGLELPDLSAAPVIDPLRTDSAARLLRHVTQTTQSGGHSGVLYDNRDRGHSALPERGFPGLARLQYARDLRGEDFGLATRLRYPFVVLGNSSTALTSGPRPRSLMRLAMTEPGFPRLVFGLATNDHLYLYPEHRDHDAVDLYPANWSYMVTSQGSSGSDRAFLQAFAMTLAAFSGETMAAMRAEGLVVPTLQMIMRRNLEGVDREATYFTAAAHPTVFDGRRLRPERMIGHAAALTPETLPPAVRLGVVSEDFSDATGLAGLSEVLFTTPSAIARIWRGWEAQKSLTLSAAGSRPRTEAPLRFRWVLLRGDPERVEITPDSDTQAATITLRWHDAFKVPSPHGPITTSRVDVGVFAETGGEPSAPAIVSISFPTHQVRTYAAGADGIPRLAAVGYDAAGRGVGYDPMLHWSAPWTDEALRDETGGLVGWRRTGGGALRDVAPGDDGPAYEVLPDAAGRPTLREVPG